MEHKIVLFLLGVVLWTFLEYVIHRFLGHKKNSKNIIKKEHGQHHSLAHYFVPLHKKALMATVVLIVCTLLTGAPFGLANGIAFSLGLAGMYFVYEVTHRLFHSNEPLIKYGLRMRKHHFYHHFRNPNVNHGVTTAFWDRIFRTHTPTDIIPVPKKMAMPWLLEEENLKAKFAQHFRLLH